MGSSCRRLIDSWLLRDDLKKNSSQQKRGESGWMGLRPREFELKMLFGREKISREFLATLSHIMEFLKSEHESTRNSMEI